MSAGALSEGLPDLWSWIEWRAARSPDRPLAFDEHDRRLDFGAFRRQAERVAAGLVAAGLVPGTRVAWILPTRLESLVLAGALARLGCEQVPLMPTLGRRELGFVLSEARPDQVIIGPIDRGTDHATLVRAYFESEVESEFESEAEHRNALDEPQGEPRARLLELGSVLPEAAISGLAKPVPSAGDPLRWIFYTSGTTSNPKGVLHTDGTLLGGAVGLEAPHRFDADDCVSLLFPFAHIGGPTLLFSALRVGHALILVERFDPSVVVETLSRHGVTLAGSGPAFWQIFIEAQRAKPDRILFPRLRALIGGGASKPAHLHAEAREVFGVPILSGYGSTECPGLAYNHLGDAEEVLKTDGRAVEGVEIRIVRSAGQDAASGAPEAVAGGEPPSREVLAVVGDEGEIRVRGPMLCRGYLGELEFPLDEEGFFRTGDLGRLDSGGQLIVTGRIKDIIIRKGENISAKEIEDLLGAHPGIAEVAVVGLPDAERGELCCAIVVPRPGGESLALRDITAYCAEAGLMKFKYPEQLELVDTLPRNSTGKILKADLRKQFSEGKSTWTTATITRTTT